MTTDTHQGFTNYATFGVVATLENDRKMSDKVRALTFAAIDAAPTSENVKDDIWTVDETERFSLADALKDYVETLNDDNNPGLMTSQLAQAGLCEVDWTDAARHFLRFAKTEWER